MLYMCYICGKRFDHKDKNLRKVKNCCNFTEEYNGEAHCICNLIYAVSIDIQIILHSRSNYDLYLMVKSLSQKY